MLPGKTTVHIVAPTIWLILRTFLEIADVRVADITEEGDELMRPGAGGEARREGAVGLTLGLEPTLIGELVAV